ncbi:hypothetical protein VTH82DRAFT_633 [Thermothelomyces myriococcoides]
MAKSARSRIVKENNRKLKKNVFGPAEAARLERLSAKLIALATAPKPEKDVEMNEEPTNETKEVATKEEKEDTAMDVEDAKPPSKKLSNKKKVEKRRRKKSSIVFPMRGPKRNKK